MNLKKKIHYQFKLSEQSNFKSVEKQKKSKKSVLPKIFWNSVKYSWGLLLALLISVPMNNNEARLLNSIHSKLEYHIDNKGTSLTNKEINGGRHSFIDAKESFPQYTYDYYLKSDLQVEIGNPKSIYLAYRMFNNKISEENFHKISFHSSKISNRDTFLRILPWGIGKPFVTHNYLEKINFTAEIQYTSFTDDKQKPLYLIIIDGQNNVTVNLLMAHAEPFSKVNFDDAKNTFYNSRYINLDTPSFENETGEDLLDEKNNLKHQKSFMDKNQYTQDVTSIKTIANEYFVN